MATGVDFTEANCRLGAPEGMEDSVYPLRVHYDPNEPLFVSKWMLTEEEIKEIQATGFVWLYICSNSHPPVHVQGTNPFKHPNPCVEVGGFEKAVNSANNYHS